MARILQNDLELKPEITDDRFQMVDDGAVEQETGELLYSFIRRMKPENVLETGTYTGISSLYMSHTGYTVEMVVSDATTVREYVSSAGIVFGIAWDGYVNPDLTQLLGSFWGEYSSASKNSSRKFGRKHQQISTDNIVVEKWGHMRNLQGRAYVPSLDRKSTRLNS